MVDISFVTSKILPHCFWICGIFTPFYDCTLDASFNKQFLHFLTHGSTCGNQSVFSNWEHFMGPFNCRHCCLYNTDFRLCDMLWRGRGRGGYFSFFDDRHRDFSSHLLPWSMGCFSLSMYYDFGHDSILNRRQLIIIYFYFSPMSVFYFK